MRNNLTFWKVALIRYKTNLGQPRVLVIHNNSADRTVRWRYVIQVSDLSATDGRVLAYRGIDG
jgi:hypothetical protein